MTAERDEPYPFDWARLVASAVHPIKVEIVEAMHWIGQPLSANDLNRLFQRRYSLSRISYHLTRLAALGVVEEVDRRQVRGAIEHFYFFRETSP